MISPVIAVPPAPLSARRRGETLRASRLTKGGRPPNGGLWCPLFSRTTKVHSAQRAKRPRHTSPWHTLPRHTKPRRALPRQGSPRHAEP